MQADQTVFQDLTGKVIKGYEIRQLIGNGGFGAVYKAYQPAVERDVAIKVILPEHANNPNFIKRFEAEAQVVARLEHLHIVPLYDYWREVDIACLVMRWLKGGSLQDSIDQYGAWDMTPAAHLLEQIASALSSAHHKGVVHRDLKPANILLDEDQNGYLADFGIAKILTSEPQIVTDDDRFGSPAYISPEQVMGDPVSPQTDIYSLGVVLYMLLTGRTPFLDPSTTTVIKRHLSEPLPPVQNIRPELPHAINLIIWKATSKRPEARYGDALSVASEFRQIVAPGGLPIEITRQLATPTPQNITMPPGGRTLIVEASPEPENPYKGLRAFQEADASDFFGRDRLIDKLVSRLKESTANARLLAVVGPSGSGKSSVVRAGLIPALRRGALPNSDEGFYLQITPGSNPLQELADALLRIAVKPPEALLAKLQTNEHALIDALEEILPLRSDELILVIDQFEEVFTQVTNEAVRAHFLNLLLASVSDPRSRLRLIITLRADMYDRPLLYPAFGEVLSTRFETILPLNSQEIEQAIVSPAERINMRFEPGLVDSILADIKQQPGALPLLQYALTELFERRDGFLLTRAGYTETGGVLGALASRADELYDGLDSDSQRATRQLFLRLVTLGEGVEDTRRRVLRSQLNAIARDRLVIQHVIDSFGKYRLLTFDYEQSSRAPTVEIAHEALIRVWERLRDWLNESRSDLILHRRLSEATSEWVKSGHDASFLAAGSRLAQFESLTASPALILNDDEAAFVRASMVMRADAETRRRRITIGLAVLALVAIGLAIFAWNSRTIADQQASISRSRELAVTALTGVQESDLALLLSLESLNAADTFEARNSLLASVQHDAQVKTFLRGDFDAVRTIAYSPDGHILASAGRDGAVYLWDAVSLQQIARLTGHTDYVNSLAFSPDSHMLASGSLDNTVRLWDVETGKPIGQPLVAYQNNIDVWSVAISTDGKIVATGYLDGSIVLWDAATGKQMDTLSTVDENIIFSLAFSPDGALLASGSEDGMVRLWDTTSWQPLTEPMAGHNGSVFTVAFNPDSTLLASAGVDENIIFWDTYSGERVTTIPSGHTQQIRSLAFSPDGKYFASGSHDDTIRLWDNHSGEPVGKPFAVHTDQIWSIAFSPDSQTLASGSLDKSIILWKVAPQATLGQVLPKQTSPVITVAYSPDGKQFATAGGNILANTENDDDTIHLWDAAARQEITTLKGHSFYVTSIVYSPDGKLLASGSGDSTIRIWDVATGENIRVIQPTNPYQYITLAFSPDGKTLAAGGDGDDNITLWDIQTGAMIGQPFTGHTDTIQTLAFSPDGKTLASGSFDMTIILWNVASGKPTGAPLTGHDSAVTTLAFSPDGRTLASGSRDTTIILWNVATRQPIGQPLVGHTDDVNTIAFSPDGALLASGSADKTVALWDITEGKRLGQPFTGHTGPVWGVAFSPDGSQLVSGDQNNTVIVWETALTTWAARACAVANRNLTPSEWERYFGAEPYRATCPPAST
jgi:WD40 repeat protein/serine/threonine protein kinase